MTPRVDTLRNLRVPSPSGNADGLIVTFGSWTSENDHYVQRYALESQSYPLVQTAAGDTAVSGPRSYLLCSSHLTFGF